MIEDYTEERQNTATLMIIQNAQQQNDNELLKLRTKVHCDSSYPEQSSAVIEVWHEPSLSWHQVATATVPRHSYTAKRDTAYAVSMELLERAGEVLNLFC